MNTRRQNDLIALAHQVARNQRGSAALQDLDIIWTKLYREAYEFAEAAASQDRVTMLGEAADLAYYQAQLGAYGVAGVAHDAIMWLLTAAGITIEEAERAALAKYRVRAKAPNSKDHEAEAEAIREAFRIS